MKRKLLNNKITVTLAIAMAFFALAPTVLAEEQSVVGDDVPTTNKIIPRQDIKSRIDAKRLQAREKIDSQRLEKATKLAENKLKVCKKHEQSINNLMFKMHDRGTKRLEMFNKTVERIKAFYVDKGLTVENYSELLAAVEDSKVAAEASIANTKSSSVEFKCDGTDPRGASMYFKEDLKSQNEAMKNYRSAIKDLIKAVKTSNSANNQAKGQEN